LILKQRKNIVKNIFILTIVFLGIVACGKDTYWPSLELISETDNEGYVEINGVDLSEYTNGFTIEIWFRIDEAQNGAPCIFQFPGQNQSNALAIFADPINTSELIVFWKNEQSRISFTGDILDGEFHSLMCSWDGTYINAYVDGSRRLQKERSFLTENNLTRMLLGADFDEGSTKADNTFTGLVHELRIWSTALTDELISFHGSHADKLLEIYNPRYMENLDHVWRFNSSNQNTNLIPDDTPKSTKVDAQVIGSFSWSMDGPN
jgi:hypothetical protein